MENPIVSRGSSDANGSWNTYCTPRRSLASRAPIQPRDILGIHPNVARLRLFEADDAAPGRGFAAAGLAHQRQGLAMPHHQAHLLDRMDATGKTKPTLDIEARGQVA